MKLSDMQNLLDLQLLTTGADLSVDVSKVHSGDMLSEVMGNASENSIWVTIQIHENVLGVALLKSFKGIIFSGGRKPEEKIIVRAEKEGIALFSSDLASFSVSGKLFQSGLEA